ncbi:L,D-transpeptidase family protein [Streptomyces sp. NPDC088729]|uniref:L,D-transpeptidase family protein n=1 Tax=Streptomyces sp. NPDC088729 TaxID=3365876 RepID=UPI003820A8C5
MADRNSGHDDRAAGTARRPGGADDGRCEGTPHPGRGVPGPGPRTDSGPRARTGSGPGAGPSLRVAAVSALAVAALVTGCEPVAVQGAGSKAASPPHSPPPAARTASAAAPAPPPTTSAPADADDAKPGGEPSAAPSATGGGTTDEPPEPGPRTAPAERVLLRPGSRSAHVRALQARLRQTGHFGRNPTGFYGDVTAGAVRAFQTDRGLPATGSTDLTTWRALLSATRAPTPDELDPPTERPVAAPDERCLTGRVLCISKRSRTLAWMIDGRVVSAMDVRFGSQYTPTREGVFAVYWKSRHHVSTLYDTPMPYALFFSGGQAVHFSADFAANGYGGASHGCVNVRDEKKIAALFAQVRKDDKVVVYR